MTSGTPLDEFSRQLFVAIDARDMARIHDLKAQGARIDHPNPSYPDTGIRDPGRRITPVSYAAVNLEWIADDLEELIGLQNKDVPLGAVTGEGRALNLYEVIAQKCTMVDYEMVLARLKSCFDRSSQSVADAMWDGAIAAADRLFAGASAGDKTYAQCARDILRAGICPSSSAKYLDLLSKPTMAPGTEKRELRFVDEPICANTTVLMNWIDHGLSPDLRIEGAPLLHYMARNNRVEAVVCLLEAGADVDAKREYRQCHRHLDVPGQPRTALDVARGAGANEAAQAIESFLAKRRIDAVLSAAKNRIIP